MRRKVVVFTVMLLFVSLFLGGGRVYSVAFSQERDFDSFARLEPNREGMYEIILRSREFEPRVGFDLELSQNKKALENEGAYIHVFMQFYNIPTLEERELLQAADITLLDYIPRTTWLAAVPSQDIESIFDSMHKIKLVRWIGAIFPQDKMPGSLWEGNIGNWALVEGNRIQINVSFFDDVLLHSARSVIARHGGVVEEETPLVNRFTVTLPLSELEALASEDSVRWIESISPAPEPHNDGVRDAVNVGAVQGPASYNLTGQGVTIGMWDYGAVDWTHSDFVFLDGTPRVISITTDIHDHATHTAGTMAGNGSGSLAAGGTAFQWRGIATNTQIVSYDYYAPDFTYHEAINTYDIDLAQNAWGDSFGDGNCEQYGDYNLLSEYFDKIVGGGAGRSIPIVFSAGNEGDTHYCYGQKPYGNIVTPGGTAKNVITVGAVNSDDKSVTDFSSQGPVDDGRLKPEIVAPGCELGGEGYINSTLPGNSYGETMRCGTSTAAATVSGISALLIEQYRQIYHAEPLPSTIKAVLVHSAQDLNTPGPDYATGYGLVDAKAAADLVCTKAVTVGKISPASNSVSYTISIPDDATQLKITLAWDDLASAPHVNSNLVNDLDLIVRLQVGKSYTVYRPWILDASNPANSAQQDAGKDGINNIEQVFIDNPPLGEWTVYITGHSLPQRTAQSFSLVSEVLVNPVDAGLCYLRQNQESNGSWSDNLGVTSLASLAFLNWGYDESDSTVKDAINYTLSYTQTDGSICNDCPHATYETSIALMVLKATHAYTGIRESAKNWLMQSQWDDQSLWDPITEDNAQWGGFGYGNGQRPDLSNTQFAVMALDSADLPSDSDIWSRVRTYISRCQNRTESNDGFSPGNDGGFIYIPGDSAIGGTTSHASITGAGMWSMAVAGLDPTEPRFSAALDWVQEHYSWSEHLATDRSLGDARIYYYYLGMAKALTMARKASIASSTNGSYWYGELRDELITRQGQDGSWVNTSPEAWENNPNLVTAYAILALQTRELPPDADLETVIILHSPADLHLYDWMGRHVGYNYETGSKEQEIPHSVYQSDHPQTISLTPPTAGNYHLEMWGTETGEWQLEIIGKYKGVETSYASYTGSITSGMVLATDLNLGAFVGPLTIYSTVPEERPVMQLMPDTLEFVGQLGETLQADFVIAETTGITTPIQRISIWVPFLDNQFGSQLDLIIDPYDIPVLQNGRQTVTLEIPLPSGMTPGFYEGIVVVESINSGAKALELEVRAGLTYLYLPVVLKSK